MISALSYVSRWRLDTGTVDGRTYQPPVQERAQLASEAAATFAAAIPGTARAVIRTSDAIVSYDFTTGESTPWIRRDDSDRSVQAVSLSPDGKLLAVQHYGGEVRLWDVEKKKDLPRLTYNGVYFIGLFLRDRLLHTTGTSGEQRVWDVSGGQEAYRYYVGYGARISPDADGKALTIVDGSRVSVVPLDPEQWAARLCTLVERGMTDGERKLAPAGSRTDDVCPGG
jgi:WD40 repeat protein